MLGTGTIPAKQRYIAGNPTYCLDVVPAIYVFNGNGNWNIAANWVDEIVPSAVLANGSQIIIDPEPAGECILNIPYVVNPGVTLTVVAGKRFTIGGNLSQVQ